jgi:hypothetical protein
MSATRINLPNGEIIGYDGLDHNKVAQRREDAALTNPIVHDASRSEIPSHHALT